MGFNKYSMNLNDFKRNLDSKFQFINRSEKERIIAFVDGIQRNLEAKDELEIVSNELKRVIEDWKFDKIAFLGSIIFFLIFFVLGASFLFLVLNKLLFD